MTQTVSVALQAEIISVTGTINDVAVTWNRVGDEWQAVCEKSTDNKYHVEIAAINSLGAVSDLDFVLEYEGLSLITWRTAADVSRAISITRRVNAGTATEDELDQWENGNLIGSYNATDLNRVGNAVQYLTERLAEVGCVVATVGKADWTTEDVPNTGNIAYYLNDIQLIRDALTLTDSTPPCPESLSGLDYQQANDIEKILEDVDAMITTIMRTWMYAGEVYAGGMY